MNAKKHELIYRPYPGFQERVLFSKADYLLVGGETGPGKSFIGCYSMLFDFNAPVLDDKTGKYGPQHLFEHPLYCGLVLRRESTQLEKLKTIAAPLYAFMGGEWRGQPMQAFVFKSGARIYFRHMQLLDDYLQFQGWEIQKLFMDELTQFEESQMVNLFTWNRSFVDGLRTSFLATTNWVGIGLDWVKRQWDVKCPCKKHQGVNSLFIKEAEIDGVRVSKKWEFIPAKLEGSYSLGKDPAYKARLALQFGGKDSMEYQALGEGCTEVAKGSFFNMFSDVHVIPDDLVLPGNYNWVKMGGYDFATSSEGDAAAFVAGMVNEHRDLVVEDEWFSWGMDVVGQSEAFRYLYEGCGSAFAGKDIFADDQGGEIKSIAMQFVLNCLVNGPGEVNFIKADYDLKTIASIVKSGLMATRNHLHGCIYIRERCARLISDFKLIMADLKEMDKWDTKQRITVNKKQYHFDVLMAFMCLVFGARTSISLPEPVKDASVKRQKNMEKAGEPEHNKKYSINYSL